MAGERQFDVLEQLLPPVLGLVQGVGDGREVGRLVTLVGIDIGSLDGVEQVFAGGAGHRVDRPGEHVHVNRAGNGLVGGGQDAVFSLHIGLVARAGREQFGHVVTEGVGGVEHAVGAVTGGHGPVFQRDRLVADVGAGNEPGVVDLGLVTVIAHVRGQVITHAQGGVVRPNRQGGAGIVNLLAPHHGGDVGGVEGEGVGIPLQTAVNVGEALKAVVAGPVGKFVHKERIGQLIGRSNVGLDADVAAQGRGGDGRAFDGDAGRGGAGVGAVARVGEGRG